MTDIAIGTQVLTNATFKSRGVRSGAGHKATVIDIDHDNLYPYMLEFDDTETEVVKLSEIELAPTYEQLQAALELRNAQLQQIWELARRPIPYGTAAIDSARAYLINIAEIAGHDDAIDSLLT